MWSLLVAIGFFLLSHPRAMFPNLTTSLWRLAALCLVVALVDARRIRPPVPPWAVVFFFGACSASMLWSVSPSDTARALGMYGAIALFGCLVVANTDTRALLRGIVWGALLVTGATYWTLWLERTGGQLPAATTTVAGFHGNRNVVSYTLVLGLCALLCYRPRGRFGQVRWCVALVSVLTLLFLSGSGTGTLGGVVVLIVAAALTFSRRVDLFATLQAKIVGGVVVAGVALASFMQLGAISARIGRTTDLSGRGPLWEAVTEVWARAPAGGYGFGAVWSYSWFSASPNAPKALIDEKTGMWLAHGHNILFDLLPQVGILGVVSIVLVLVFALRWLFEPLDDVEYAAARWSALGLLGVVLCGLTEPMLAVPVGWFVVVTAAASAQRIASGRGLRL